MLFRSPKGFVFDCAATDGGIVRFDGKHFHRHFRFCFSVNALADALAVFVGAERDHANPIAVLTLTDTALVVASSRGFLRH